MDIKEFVKTTLKELSEALKESTNELGKQTKLTNTILRTQGHGNYGLIDFDLAVEASQTGDTGAKAGVRIAVVEAHVGNKGTTHSSNSSRIKFTVEANF